MTSNASEPTYTMAEAVAELIRRNCAEGHHAPDQAIRTVDDPIGFWVCQCTAVRWTATGVGAQ